jgi:hypothetical protein
MKKLLLYHRDGSSFDIGAASQALNALPGTIGIREHLSDEAIIEVDFEDSNGSSTIRLNGSGDSILLTWSSDTALHAAVLIQQHYRHPLRAIDLDYSFELDLSRLVDLGDVKRALASS